MAKKGYKKNKAKANICKKCDGKCCKYFALPIETPEDWDDFDDIRWYLAHKDVTVFVEDGDWYLNVKNHCRHLDPDSFMCQIYEKRPRICRKYKTDDCDLSGENYDFELHFADDKQMEEYMKIKFGPNVLDKLEKKKSKKKRHKRKIEAGK